MSIWDGGQEYRTKQNGDFFLERVSKITPPLTDGEIPDKQLRRKLGQAGISMRKFRIWRSLTDKNPILLQRTKKNFFRTSSIKKFHDQGSAEASIPDVHTALLLYPAKRCKPGQERTHPAGLNPKLTATTKLTDKSIATKD